MEHKKRPEHMMLEIQVLDLGKGTQILVGLNQFMGPPPS